MNRSCHEEKQMATISAKAPLFHIRNMTRKDIPQVLTVWSQHGLDEAVETVETFLTLDPGAFFVAEIDDSGRLKTLLCLLVRQSYYLLRFVIFI